MVPVLQHRMIWWYAQRQDMKDGGQVAGFVRPVTTFSSMDIIPPNSSEPDVVHHGEIISLVPVQITREVSMCFFLMVEFIF